MNQNQLAFNQILTVAKVEYRLIMRTFVIKILWFLYFLVTLYFILDAHLIGNITPNVSGSLAIKTFFYYSLFRMILSTFIAPVFIHKDRRMDTFQSISSRPFTNTEYTFGKLLGFITIMLSMDYVFMGALFVSSSIRFGYILSPIPYLLYPIIITIPLCIFLFGVNVAVARLYYPLVYMVPILIFMVFLPLEDRETSRIFDLGAITLPLAYSSINGFHELPVVILSRLQFVSAGLGLILIGIFLMQSDRKSGTRSLTLTGAGLAAALTIICTVGSYLNIIHDLDIAKDILQDNNSRPHVLIDSCDLTVTHEGKSLDIKARMKITNPSNVPLETIFLKHNIGFTTYAVTSKTTPIQAYRREPLDGIAIELGSPLLPNESIELDISERGSISPASTYLHIPMDMRTRVHREGLTTLAKQLAYIERDYVLLPAEVSWYPTAYSEYLPNDPGYVQRDLTKFTLTVITNDGMVPISQGEMIEKGNNTYLFEPEMPLTQMSLAIGPYQKISIDVDGIEYSYWWIGANPFENDDITKDTVTNAIQEYREKIESSIHMVYPFRRYQIVETPIHFFGYQSPIDLSGPFDQPEIKFIPESSVVLSDFYKRDNVASSQRTIFTKHFSKLVRRSYNVENIIKKMNPTPYLYFVQKINEFTTDPFIDYSSILTQYTVFPHGTSSNDLYINLIFLNMLHSKTSFLGQSPSIENYFQKVHYRLLDRAQDLYLNSKSLENILSEDQYFGEAVYILQNATKAFFQMLAAKYDIPIEKIEFAIIDGFLTNTDTSIAVLSELCGEDFTSLFYEFLAQTKEARYEIENIQVSRHLVDSHEYFNTIVEITNPTPNHGLINFDVDDYSNNRVRREVYIEPYTKKLVGVVSDREPQFISCNWLPFMINDTRGFEYKGKIKEFEDIPVFDGVRTISSGTIPKEVIIDNLDEQCRIISTKKQNPVRTFLNERAQRKGYLALSTIQEFENPPDIWTLTKYRFDMTGMFYGLYNSCYCTKSGDGKSLVEYTIPIPEPGQYEVFISVPSRSGRYGGFRVTPLQVKELGETTVLIHTNDEVHEVTIDISKIEEDWALIGTYTFTGTTGIIQISDKSTAGMVIADAVKLRQAY